MNLDKIARKIVGYKSIDILTDINEVIIVLTNDSIVSDVERYASDKSFYSLNEVKQLINCKPVKIKFKYREDGKNDLSNLNMNLNECVNVIKTLSNDNFDKTLYNLEYPADVYKLFDYEKDNNKINLYIKFSIIGKSNKRHVFIISFHKEGM